MGNGECNLVFGLDPSSTNINTAASKIGAGEKKKKDEPEVRNTEITYSSSPPLHKLVY